MSKADFYSSTPGEIYDLVACHLVTEGLATEVQKKKTYSYDEALQALRT